MKPWTTMVNRKESQILASFSIASVYIMNIGVKLLQLVQTLCNPMDCSPPGSTVPRILQARILEWVAMPSSSGDLPDPGIEPISFLYFLY